VRRVFVWIREDGSGAEYCFAEIDGTTLRAEGVQLGTRPRSYRLDYALVTGPDFCTSSLQARASGDLWERVLDLVRLPDGAWRCHGRESGASEIGHAGGDPAAWAGALDCDLAFSPLTNTMPILRDGLAAGRGPVDLLMAWVSVPDLSVRPSRQRYEPISARRVRYRSDSFSAELELDSDGFVRHYPGLAREASR
jgi:hypothetical protein